MKKIELTKQQQLCVDSVDKSTAILAGAGTGKTAVLIGRILKLVTSKKASLSDIVAITFTEKAAGELVYRLTQEMPARLKPQMDLATVTTIDGFCTKILREDASIIGINPDFRIIEEHASRILIHRITSTTIKELLKNGDDKTDFLVDELEYRYAVGCLEELIEKRWHTERWLGPDRTAPKEATEKEALLVHALKHCFEIILDRIEEEKKRLSILDFQDIEIKTHDLFKKNKVIRDKYQSRIKHLLIDEFQDTSDLQVAIIKNIFNPKKNKLCIVGDPSQSIYRFRGANPNGIKEMRELIESSGGLTVRLSENFRSTRPVIDFINVLFSHNEGDFQPLVCGARTTNPAGVRKIAIDASSLKAGEIRQAEAKNIASYISSLGEKGGPNYGDIAMLFRSFTDINIYEEALAKRGIPYYRSGGQSLLEQTEIGDIILCLRALAHPENDTYIYGLMRSTLVGLTDDDCYKLAAHRNGRLFDLMIDEKSFDFFRTLLDVKNFLSIGELIRKIVETSHLHHVFEAIRNSGQPAANIEKFIALVENLSLQYDYSLDDLLDYIDDLRLREIGISEPPIFSPRENAVKLLTVHAAKGLEFKTIILPDLCRSGRNYQLPYIHEKNTGIGFKLREGTNPISSRKKTEFFEKILQHENSEERDETERLLYVAATRAKENLIISEPCLAKSESDWLLRLKPALKDVQNIEVKGSETLPEGPKASLKYSEPYLPGETKPVTTLTASHVETYFRCPVEYYLKYIAHIPADMVKPVKNEMPANIIGDIVHKIIDLIAKDKETNWHRLIPVLCSNHGYAAPPKSDTLHIKNLIENYLNGAFSDPHLQEPIHELPFLMPMEENILISGKIDCIYKEGGKHAILDFKTGEGSSKDIDERTREYELQTAIYALAAKRALGKDISKTTLLFLAIDKSYSVILDAPRLDEWRNIIAATVNAITKFGPEIIEDISPDDNRPCERCIYNKNKTCFI